MNSSDYPRVKEWLGQKCGTVEAGDTNEEVHQYLIKCEKASFVNMDTGESILGDKPDEDFDHVKFRTLVQEGDEIWTYSSDKDSWQALAGRAGYAIVRDGNVKEALCTIMS